MRRWRAIFNISTNKNNRAGFTMIELIVVIVISGVISTAAIVSWVSFIQYQELRRAAQNMHKELLALKARALESGDNYRVEYTQGQSSYEVWRIDSEGAPPVRTGTVTLPNRVTVGFGSAENNNACPGWSCRINIASSALNAFEAGEVVITRNGAQERKMFRIERAANEVNPRIFFTNNSGVSWAEM